VENIDKSEKMIQSILSSPQDPLQVGAEPHALSPPQDPLQVGAEPRCGGGGWCYRTPTFFSTPYIPYIFIMDDTINLSFVTLTIH
jgi:hypothetical protein